MRVTAADGDPHVLLREILAVQVSEGMRWSVNPELADLVSDQAAMELAALALDELTRHRRARGYGR